MTVKELRDGNIVLHSGKFYILDSFDIYKLDTTNCEDVQPIELTEEILLKCGFVKDEFDNWENETRLGLYKPEEFDGYLSVWGESTVGECNYLHQLQNLYYALTGQELEINL